MPNIEELRKTYRKLIDLIDETDDPVIMQRLIESAHKINRELKEAYKHSQEAQAMGDLLDQALNALAEGKAATDKAKVELQREKVEAIKTGILKGE